MVDDESSVRHDGPSGVTAATGMRRSANMATVFLMKGGPNAAMVSTREGDKFIEGRARPNIIMRNYTLTNYCLETHGSTENGFTPLRAWHFGLAKTLPS
jgi:hypothetical protein